SKCERPKNAISQAFNERHSYSEHANFKRAHTIPGSKILSRLQYNNEQHYL
ncbi:3402_t:CDS:1, partial [Cetraspora pellucida]